MLWDCSVTLNARMPEYATQEWRDFSVKVAKGEIQTVAALLFGEFRTKCIQMILDFPA